MVNIPIIHYSVEYLNSLHQGQTLMSSDAEIGPDKLYPLLAMILGFTFLFGAFLLRRVRTEVLYRERRKRWVKEMVLSAGGRRQ